MGVTALGLLIIMLVNCVIMTQKKSKFLFLFSFIHLCVHPFVWEVFLGHFLCVQCWAQLYGIWRSQFCRSLEPGVEAAPTNLSNESKHVRAVQGAGV